MQHHRGIFMLALLAFLLVLTVLGTDTENKDKQEKKAKKSGCGEWQWSVCVPSSGDCGIGMREATRSGKECKQKAKTQKCKIPCNWKKQFGADCKYQFQDWGECDPETLIKTRNGNLKRALHNANCDKIVTLSRECGKITKPPKSQDSKKKKKEGKKQDRMVD